MSSIADLIGRIREHINKPRKQYLLIESGTKWNMLCSSMDVIEDTELAFDAYIEKDYPAQDGDKYLLVYGLLQALFVQQDAMRNLCKALDIKYEITSELRTIREIRNDSIGHPTKRNSGPTSTYNYISRVTLQKPGFQLMTEYSDGRHESFREINILELVDQQRKQLEEVADNVISKLEKEEKQHKSMYKDKKLMNLFPPTLYYYFSKMKEATYNRKNLKLGTMHIELVNKCLSSLRERMEKRQIFNAYDSVRYLYEEIKYPLDQLGLFFKNDTESCLNEKGAYIFVYYLEQRIEELKDLVSEIDVEYGGTKKHTT